MQNQFPHDILDTNQQQYYWFMRQSSWWIIIFVALNLQANNLYLKRIFFVKQTPVPDLLWKAYKYDYVEQLPVMWDENWRISIDTNNIPGPQSD